MLVRHALYDMPVRHTSETGSSYLRNSFESLIVTFGMVTFGVIAPTVAKTRVATPVRLLHPCHNSIVISGLLQPEIRQSFWNLCERDD